MTLLAGAVRALVLNPMVYEFVLLCVRCGHSEGVTVSHVTQIYRAMNERSWTLVPTHHSDVVSGICPSCRPKEIAAG